MEDNKDFEALDSFHEKYIKEIEQEVPSIDFTNNIMNVILEEETQKALTFEYTPLISKRVWYALLVVFIGVILYVLSLSPSAIFPKLNVSFELPEISLFSNLNLISLSTNMTYVLVLISFLVLGQFYFLKKRFESMFKV